VHFPNGRAIHNMQSSQRGGQGTYLYVSCRKQSKQRLARRKQTCCCRMPQGKILLLSLPNNLPVLFHSLPQWLCSRNDLVIGIIAEAHPTLDQTKRIYQRKTSMSKLSLDLCLELAVDWRRRLLDPTCLGLLAEVVLRFAASSHESGHESHSKPC